MKLRNLRIGMRLGLSFGLILVILTIAVAGSAYLTEKNKRNLIEGLEAANSKGILVATMKSALLESGIAMRNMLDFSAVQNQKKRVEVQTNRYAEARDKLQKFDLSAEEKKILAAIADLDKQVNARYKVAMTQAEGLNSEGAASIITTYIDPLNMKTVAEMDKLVALEQALAQQVLDNSVTADRRLMIALFAICTVALAIGIGFAWFITRSITGPLNNAVQIAKSVASGDLTSQVQDRAHDEISQLLEALGQMNYGLREIVENVRVGASAMEIASREIASGNADLSSRTEAQAGSLEETASSIEELTSTIRQNADNAHQANQLAASASDVAVRGGKVVGEVVQTMNSIKDSSRKIVEITSVIDGIAFQTNILALNAAVEAARAGEQGRGFAVVASEVRSLAQRSATAAKEIKVLIDDSVGQVDTGSKLVSTAGTTMTEIVDQVKKVTNIMSELLVASEEQRAGIEQVNQSVGQIEQVTQQNAALVEQAAAAAENVQEQAARLAQAVSVFKT